MSRPPPTQLLGITDLTVIAPVKQGLIDGIFDSRTYEWRLRRVLALLDAARHITREGDLVPSPRMDIVGRWRGIHFFRFAVLPPGDRLLLNVSFDGGWEPYMRVIWGPLGTMLDLIFCHCDGYPLAAVSAYDDYVAWVRRHEIPSQFFYVDTGGTVADRAYLEGLEARQRVFGARPDADLRAAQLALAPVRPPPPSPLAVQDALRALRAIHGLRPFFGRSAASGQPAPTDDEAVLLRFAQDYLSDLREWVARGEFDPGQPYDVWRPPLEAEFRWLMNKRPVPPQPRQRRGAPEPQSIQGGILRSPAAPHGCRVRGALVLVHVIDAAKARKWLREAAGTGPGKPAARISDGTAVELTADRVFCTVAITYHGLRTLGAHPDKLAALPAEFVQGMEGRAGILGDVRGNHPQHWTRPRPWATPAGQSMPPVDLGSVHLVIQLRTCEAGDEANTTNSWALLPRLKKWIDGLPADALEVLAVEPGWSRPKNAGEPAARDHFGYVDGISQPSLTPSAQPLYWDDGVKTGEFLLGWPNGRGDGVRGEDGDDAATVGAGWMALGTFVVVRKIRQYVGRFDTLVERTANALVNSGIAASRDDARELVRAKLMGRGSDGRPLVTARGSGPNDFDFRNDADGAQCPFASHVRRANPRTATPGGPVPRLLRRGMSYGPPGSDERGDDDRGILFVAYNASIAEQFEVVQRWLTGGNSSGVSSAQTDPFVGVPFPGQVNVFRFVHDDRVVRVDLGDQPISALQWGLYAFVPSILLLRDIDALTRPDTSERPVAARSPAVRNVPPETRDVKRMFEDELVRDRCWADVRSRSGVQRIGGCVVVGGYETVLQVLRDGGTTYSARGYGERMKQTLGESPFGRDDVGPHDGHQQPHVAAVKAAIVDAVDEAKAFATAEQVVTERLAGRLSSAQALRLPAATVDVVQLGQELIADLLARWFGVRYDDRIAQPGGLDPSASDQPVRCPGHFLSVARYVFSAYPNPVVEALAKRHSQPLKEAAAGWTASTASDPKPAVIAAVLQKLDECRVTNLGTREGTVANVMLGLPATLLGSWAKVLVAWVRDRRLWHLQHELLRGNSSPVQYMPAKKVLRAPLVATLAADPVADGIWRTAAQRHFFRGIEVQEGDVVWLGLGSALAERPDDFDAAEDLLFGGSLVKGADRSTPHACPGRHMALGALLGGLTAFLTAGQWAATASPTTLTLKPHDA